MASDTFQGRLSKTPISAIIRSLNETGKTGVLMVKRHTIYVKLFLQQGRITFASTNDDNRKIGIYCLRTGLITIKELEDALANQYDQRIGTVLLKSGAIKKQDLVGAIQNHLREVVYYLFTFGDGSYQFQEQDIPTETIKISASTGALIFRGVMNMRQWDTIRRVVGGLDTVFQLSRSPVFPFQDLLLSADELQVLELINGLNTVADICQHSPLPDFATYTMLMGLLACGVIEKTTLISDSRENLEFRIIKTYAQLQRLTDAELLGLSSGFSRQELFNKYYAMVKKFHPEQIKNLKHKALRSKGVKILSQVQEAFKTLKKRFDTSYT